MTESTLPAIVIATRESRLALWQAEHVKSLLEGLGCSVKLLGMTTQGDQILDRSLSIPNALRDYSLDFLRGATEHKLNPEDRLAFITVGKEATIAAMRLCSRTNRI